MINANMDLNGKTLVAVMDFNIIVNTELGLIRFIRENYQDPKAFDLSIVNKSDREILSLLYSRKNINPLSVISTKENMPDIDELYKSFMDSYKKEIICKSTCQENIVRFVQTIFYGHNTGINLYIAVSDNLEEQSIRSHFVNSKVMRKTNYNDIVGCDAYYINSYSFFDIPDKFRSKILAKTLYISPMQCNLDYFSNTSNILAKTNKIVLFGKDYTKEDSTNDQ